MPLRAAKLAAVGAAATALVGASAATAGGPPPPTSHNGNKPHLVASGLGTPTAFAFGGAAVFESDAGTQAADTPLSNSPITRSKRTAAVPGGVYLLSHGTAKRLSGSPPVSFGIVWHNGTLYVSALNKLLAWSGWNGKKFTKQRVFYTAPKNFPGFNGLGFGANGRLYVGVDVGETNDHAPATAPFQYDFVSFGTSGASRRSWRKAFASRGRWHFRRGRTRPMSPTWARTRARRTRPISYSGSRPVRTTAFRGATGPRRGSATRLRGRSASSARTPT